MSSCAFSPGAEVNSFALRRLRDKNASKVFEHIQNNFHVAVLILAARLFAYLPCCFFSTRLPFLKVSCVQRTLFNLSSLDQVGCNLSKP